MKSKVKLSIKPTGFRVLIKPIIEEDEHFTLPDGSKSRIKQVDNSTTDERAARTQQGYVIAKGPTAWVGFEGDDWAEVGDKVYYTKYGGKKLLDKASGQYYILVNDEDVSGLVLDEPVEVEIDER